MVYSRIFTDLFFSLKQRRHSFRLTVIGSLMIGIYMGLNNLSMQVTTETGMVLAGIIPFPHDTPGCLYHVRVFAIVNHLSALLVALTNSPWFVNFVISILCAVLSALALGLLTFGLCRNCYWSILAVTAIINLVRIKPGIAYPIFLCGSSHTFGIMGLSFIALTLALFACRRYRMALWCVGMAPSVHPSWSIFLALILLAGGCFNFRFCLLIFKKHWLSFVFGLSISLIALIIQSYWMRILPSIPGQLQEKYLESFIRYWDFHRKPFDFEHRSVFYAIACGILAFYGVLCLKYRTGTRFVLCCLGMAAPLSLAAAGVTLFHEDTIPAVFLILMPGRYVNLSIFFYPSLLMGLLLSKNLFRSRGAGMIFLLAAVLWYWTFKQRTTITLLLIGYRIEKYGLHIIFYPLLFLGVVPACIFFYSRNQLPAKQILKTFFLLMRRAANKKVARFAFLLIFGITASCPLLLYLIRGNFLPSMNLGGLSPGADAFHCRVSRDSGLLINTSEDAMLAMKTRRPVWFDMAAFDGFPMVSAAALMLEQGLQDIYGVSILSDPGEKYRNRGILPSEKHRELWEQRTAEEWRILGEKYGFNGIVTPAGWRLNLPRLAENEQSAYFTLVQSKKK